MAKCTGHALPLRVSWALLLTALLRVYNSTGHVVGRGLGKLLSPWQLAAPHQRSAPECPELPATGEDKGFGGFSACWSWQRCT